MGERLLVEATQAVCITLGDVGFRRKGHQIEGEKGGNAVGVFKK